MSLCQQKTWIDSELMEEIFKTFNRKCAVDDWKILPFIDNASSHPEYFMDCFSHFKIDFLQENTTSKLQPLDPRAINKFEVFYRKQVLQHVLARTKVGSKVSEMISSASLLKSGKN